MNTSISINLKSFLVFVLNKKEYAITIEAVQNIIELSGLVKLPGMPGFMRGAVNYGGEKLPVIDLRVKMGLPSTVFNINTCIVITKVNVLGISGLVGLLVDSLNSVCEFSPDDILPVSDVRISSMQPFLYGKLTHQGQNLKFIDPDKLFAKWELQKISSYEREEVASMQMSMIN